MTLIFFLSVLLIQGHIHEDYIEGFNKEYLKPVIFMVSLFMKIVLNL